MDKKKLWNEALSVIKISVSPATFSTWFTQTFILSIKKINKTKNVVELGCPSSFIADALEKRYLSLIQNSLNQITGSTKNNVVFTVSQQENTKNKKEEKQPLFTQSHDLIEDISRRLTDSRIQQGFTFENFAVSSTNQMAWAAADAVSKNLGKAYNPLFLWGGVGIGKTHLMLAIGHRALTQNPDLSVLYCMGEEFTTEIVEAIRDKSTSNFKNRYRRLNLLMLDDVQFIAGKTAVQEEFFNTFNILKREGGQIVLTSDKPPSEIKELETRLRSRFEAGLTIDISPPDFELRTAIALIKARERKMEISMEVAQTIAANLDSPRRIEGFLTRLSTEIAQSDRPKPIDMDMVTKLLRKTGVNGEVNQTNKAILPQDCINAVIEYFSIGKRKLLGSNRSRPVALPRQILMYLLRVELGLPLQEVGRLVGGRDHTTVMHGVEKISNNLSTNHTLRNAVLGIKQSLSG